MRNLILTVCCQLHGVYAIFVVYPALCVYRLCVSAVDFTAQ